MFDQLFFEVFNYYKNKKKKNANTIAILYITLLQSAILLFLGVFFKEFFRQMKVTSLSVGNIWTIFVIAIVVIYFNNWMQYSGRKRNIKKAKSASSKSNNRSIVVLWLIPLLCLALSLIFLELV